MQVSWCLVVAILCLSPARPGSGYNVIRKDPFASLSETLVTHQTASCDGDLLHMECPSATKISIQLVLYGRQAPSEKVCPATREQPRVFTGYEVSQVQPLVRLGLAAISSLAWPGNDCNDCIAGFLLQDYGGPEDGGGALPGETELLYDHQPRLSGGGDPGLLPWHQVCSLIVVLGDVASVD